MTARYFVTSSTVIHRQLSYLWDAILLSRTYSYVACGNSSLHSTCFSPPTLEIRVFIYNHNSSEHYPLYATQNQKCAMNCNQNYSMKCSFAARFNSLNFLLQCYRPSRVLSLRYLITPLLLLTTSL